MLHLKKDAQSSEACAGSFAKRIALPFITLSVSDLGLFCTTENQEKEVHQVMIPEQKHITGLGEKFTLLLPLRVDQYMTISLSIGLEKEGMLLQASVSEEASKQTGEET